MSELRCIIRLFDSSGSPTSDYLDVTNDLMANSLNFKRSIDFNKYDSSIPKTSEINIKLRNDDGRFNPTNDPNSDFIYKRSGCLVEFYWIPADHLLYCGFFNCGAPDAILAEYNYTTKDGLVAWGFLNDESSITDADDQTIQFKVFGPEVFLNRAKVPYTSIANGDLASAVIYDILNIDSITDYFPAANFNIALDYDFIVDDVTPFENSASLSKLNEILGLANSVLTFDLANRIVNAIPRDPTAATQAYFYGQASALGIEDIMDINDYSTGENRILNLVKWKDTSLSGFDSGSQLAYGVFQKEIGNDFVTNTTRRQNIIDGIVTEFKNPKIELKLKTYLNEKTKVLDLLDKVKIDMPGSISTPDDTFGLSIYGAAQYDVDKYPDEINTVTIPGTMEFKIVGITIDFKQDVVVYEVREV